QDNPWKQRYWLWGSTWDEVDGYLKELRELLGDDGEHKFTKNLHRLRLTDGGEVQGMIPSHRPDGERCVAFWLSTKSVPNNYALRLLGMGQAEELWVLPSAMDDARPGRDWMQ